MRGESGQVTAYSLSREELFAESQAWKPNKFRMERESKNLALAMACGIGADDDGDQKD